MYIIREGWEGLVRGNETGSRTLENGKVRNGEAFLDTYGEGEFLKEGEAELELKGRHILRVGWDDVRGFASEGGTLIGTARSAAFRELDGRRKAACNLIKNGIEAIVCCGGDGSLTGADKLRAEWPDHVAALLEAGELAFAALRFTHAYKAHRKHHEGGSRSQRRPQYRRCASSCSPRSHLLTFTPSWSAV